MNPPQVYMRVEGGGFRMRNTCMPLPLSRDLPRSRTEPESLALQMDSLPAELLKKPMNIFCSCQMVFRSDQLLSRVRLFATP